ncbi:MAG TPA: Gfo/Idh/MocA family oxidoreductase [Acidimicrobiia bacterium]|nr:Gfo/Idh/MocA family oxidoreductase [Acidimicrobiia bacterium]
MTLRVGVVGTGFGARVVAPAFASTAGCTVADVVSARDDAAVAALCADPTLDLVCVHSPPFLHSPHVRRAIAGGHAVLCDKPFGLDAGQAQALLAAADVADCLHLLNFEFRYDATRARVRALVADGVVGTPEHVQWTHLSAASRQPLRPHGWLFDRGAGGGWVGAWGSHAVDFLRWTFGEVLDVTARCRTTIGTRPDATGTGRRCDAEDGFTALLTLADGVTAAIDSTFAAPVSMAPRLVVVGSDGVLECVADARVVVRAGDGGRREYHDGGDGDPHVEPMRRWAGVVRDCVQDGVAPPGAPTFADGLACARVLDRLRAGGERERP